MEELEPLEYPEEIWFHILGFVEWIDTLTLVPLVCKMWNRISNDPAFGKRFLSKIPLLPRGTAWHLQRNYSATSSNDAIDQSKVHWKTLLQDLQHDKLVDFYRDIDGWELNELFVWNSLNSFVPSCHGYVRVAQHIDTEDQTDDQTRKDGFTPSENMQGHIEEVIGQMLSNPEDKPYRWYGCEGEVDTILLMVNFAGPLEAPDVTTWVLRKADFSSKNWWGPDRLRNLTPPALYHTVDIPFGVDYYWPDFSWCIIIALSDRQAGGNQLSYSDFCLRLRPYMTCSMQHES